MSRRALSATAALLLLAIVPVFAQTTVIPKYTVVPVFLESGLNSAVQLSGTSFYARCCEGENCGGFPAGTRFVGQVQCVTPRTVCVPGQMTVVFTQAILPDKSVVAINGAPTSFSGNQVTVDSNGRRIASDEGRNGNNRFIGYAGNRNLLGTIANDCIRGGAIGGNCEWVDSLQVGGRIPTSNVDMPPNTAVGIALLDDVDISKAAQPKPEALSGQPQQMEAPVSTAPRLDEYAIALQSTQPYQSDGGVLMVPFREVMGGIAASFTYDHAAKSITITSDNLSARHAIGASVLQLNDSAHTLTSQSALSRDGVLFVPSDLIELLTGRSAAWDREKGELVLR